MRRLLISVFLILILLSVSETFAVKVWEEQIVIPTYAWGPNDKNPVFPATEGHIFYPYPLQDRLGAVKADRTYRGLFLENEYLRVCVLPELGGHVHEVYNKSIDKPVFYTNHVIKPNLLAMRGAWISGGVEWNTGPKGHTATCLEPIECRLLENEDGSASIVIGHVERIFRTQWTITLTLKPGVAALDEHIRLFNPREEIHPYYFWNNTAVPNTEGFQFVYPMTLGTDHAGSSFYTWPMSDGVDLSYAINRKGPSSIFAYECDQDFFGSYDHTSDRGVVATANHHLLPGKKAWSWGQSAHAILRQSLLTDDDGPYNEVQTGPLRTQADHGFLQPHQVLEWTERWYPVHGIQGFIFADRNAAFNVTKEGNELLLKFVTNSRIRGGSLSIAAKGENPATYSIKTSPETPSVIRYPVGTSDGPWSILLQDANNEPISHFEYPLPLPERTPPELPTPIPEDQKTVQDLWLEGQLFDKQSNPQKARELYLRALAVDSDHGPSLCSLTVLDLESGRFESALEHASLAVERNADLGMGWFWKSVALTWLNRDEEASESAWKAARFDESSALAYCMLARLAIRAGDPVQAVSMALNALRRNDRDAVPRNVLAAALLLIGESEKALGTARDALRDNPIDLVAASIQYLASDSERHLEILEDIVRNEPQNILEIASFWISLHQYTIAEKILKDLYLNNLSPGEGHPMVWYYAGWLANEAGQRDRARELWRSGRQCSPDYVFPHRFESIPVLRAVLEAEPNDGRAALYLGNLLFAKGQLDDGRRYWEQSVRMAPDYSVTFRNLGHAADKLDGARKQAIHWYEKALKCESEDPILYRDLARLYKAEGNPKAALALLEKAAILPNPRRDATEMLAHLYLDLGQYADAIEYMENTVFHNWEDQFTSHDLFVQAHLERGKQLMKAGDYQAALTHFQKSMTFPKNLGVERGPHIRLANSHYWEGMALKALKRMDEAKKAFTQAIDETESPKHKANQLKAAKELKSLK